VNIEMKKDNEKKKRKKLDNNDNKDATGIGYTCPPSCHVRDMHRDGPPLASRRLAQLS
jgi:hypothetical protein